MSPAMGELEHYTDRFKIEAATDWPPDRSKYVVFEIKGDSFVMPRIQWAHYNAVAEFLGQPRIIEIVPACEL